MGRRPRTLLGSRAKRAAGPEKHHLVSSSPAAPILPRAVRGRVLSLLLVEPYALRAPGLTPEGAVPVRRAMPCASRRWPLVEPGNRLLPRRRRCPSLRRSAPASEGLLVLVRRRMPWNLAPTWNILIPRQVARLESGYLGIWHGLGLPGWLVLVAQRIYSSAEKCSELSLACDVLPLRDPGWFL